MTDAANDRIGRNIDLAFQFLDEVIDAPAHADDVPDGATVVVLPVDDPEFNRGQMDLARMSATAGHETYV